MLGVCQKARMHSIKIIVPLLLTIGTADSGKWSSNHHEITVHFNEKIWSIVEEVDSENDTLIGLYDKDDGSTFLLRIEFQEDAINIPEEAIDKALIETLRNADSGVEVYRRSAMTIAGNDFRVIDYLFDNREFGTQRVRHAYQQQSNHIFMLMMSWPIEMNIQVGKNFPFKHLALIEGLSLTEQ
ncbi:MAG: hypothetical protein AAF358_19755 [Pseudomonadota bacterium]